MGGRLSRMAGGGVDRCVSEGGGGRDAARIAQAASWRGGSARRSRCAMGPHGRRRPRGRDGQRRAPRRGPRRHAVRRQWPRATGAPTREQCEGGGGVRATKWWGCAGGRWRRRARARGRRADGGAPGCATHAPPEMTGRCSGGAAAGLAERSRCRRRGRQRELRRAFTPGRQPRRLNCGAGPPSVEGRAAAQNRRARGWKWGVRETLGGASVRTCITSAARATPKDCAQGTWHGSGLLRPSPGLAKT